MSTPTINTLFSLLGHRLVSLPSKALVPLMVRSIPDKEKVALHPHLITCPVTSIVIRLAAV